MTAISAVRQLLRPTRLTFILVAAGMALIATLLLSGRDASACETIRPPHGEHRLAAERPAHHRADSTVAGKKAELRAASASSRSGSFQPSKASTPVSENPRMRVSEVHIRQQQFTAAPAQAATVHQRPVTTRKAFPLGSARKPRLVAYVARAEQVTASRSSVVPAVAPAVASAVAPPAQQQAPAQSPPAAVAVPAIPAAPSNPVTKPASRSGPITSSRPASQEAPLLIDGELAGRLESALALAAVACLFPLLAIVVLLQLRLLRLMGTRQPEKPEKRPQPAKPYYSLTHEQVRELAPDLLGALAHHRFCESERHFGRQKRAGWLELEDLEAEVPKMWATCEVCHHQRMMRLGANGKLMAQ